MKLSIVIPTLNEEKNIGRLLKALKDQTFKDYEIIVADNDSTDKTQEVARSFGARIVKGGMPGPGRNAGAKVAQGELVFFFDADVLPSPTFIERCVRNFELQELDCASCLVSPISERKIDRFLHEAINIFFRATERVFPHAPGFCILVRKSLHEKIGGFDETLKLAEDHDYVKRASKEGKFRFLTFPRIRVSVRRLERDGRFNLAAKYMMAEAYLLVFGEIRTDIFKYRFAHFDEVKQDKVRDSVRNRFLRLAEKRFNRSRDELTKVYNDLTEGFQGHRK